MTLHAPGSLVSARGREWVVLPESSDDFLVLRPLGGTDDDVAGVLPAVEHVESASFAPPSPLDLGDQIGAGLLRSALRIGFRSSAGPLRSLSAISVEPRAYQLVPLMLALRQEVIRLLISDDVGIGKTVEAALIAAELLTVGEARGLTVLCSPALAEQWEAELREKFGLEAELVLPSTVRRLERNLMGSESIFDRFPITVVSTDFIKSSRRRHEFLRTCPDLVIVDEAHTCVADSAQGGRSRTLRYDLLKDLAKDSTRHLILVTATPHSGKEEGFRNLLGLLHPDLATVDLEQVKGRELLAKHFVQRRRADIRHYLDEETPFPKDRETREVSYDLDPAYRALFENVIDYARTTVKAADGGLAQRVSWWSALALLRALASSPAAAAQTLRTRSATAEATSPADADAMGRAVVLDLADDEAIESADATPGADTGNSAESRRLREFLAQAETLAAESDSKVRKLTQEVKSLLADGFQPIVFCRFINTADYVASHLGKALGKNVTVASVTGILPPDERIRRIQELAEAKGHQVLVATDCLSEGVNLQENFQAVIHYDLAWNPTRHEQREGRVDRFGQTAEKVRAVTLYGRDNQIDGIVLEVLLRKHEAIRKATGVSVPVPDNSGAVVEALMEGLLLRGAKAEQLSLDLDISHKQTELYKQWESSAERERKAQTKYAQHGIKPTEVAAEIASIRMNLGTSAEVASFVELALRSLNSSVVKTDRGVTATTAGLPLGLKDAIPAGKDEPLPFVNDFPVAKRSALLHRSDETVAAIAHYVLESALDSQLPDAIRPARRAGVIRTDAVSKRTTLLLVRYRFHLTLPSRTGVKTIVAEEAALLGFEGAPSAAQWLSEDDTVQLLQARAKANIPSEQAAPKVAGVVDSIDELRGRLDSYGDELAERLAQSHRQVRSHSGDIVRGLDVRTEKPADILGVYVFLPVVAGGF